MVCHVSCKEGSITKGPWTREEDLKLIHHIRAHGEGSWSDVPRKAGLRRCSKSCRLRWRNYLRPDVKRGNFSEAELEIILKLHALVGNKWSLIARRLPGRTDNEIKNFWNTHMKKKLRRMGIDPGIHRIIGSAKADAWSWVPFKPTGLTIPQATVPIVRPLEDPSASSRMQPIGYSVQNCEQISSEDRNKAPSGDSNFFAGVPHENQIISGFAEHWKDDAVRSHIQAVVGDPTEEKIKYAHQVQQTDVDHWRQGDYSSSSTWSEHCLTDPTGQVSYYNSAHSNSSPSCYSSEVRQNYMQKANTQTNAKSEFMGYGGLPLPEKLTEDSDSNEIKSVQEFSGEPFSPWSGLVSASFINNYLQSMDVLGDGSDHFGGF